MLRAQAPANQPAEITSLKTTMNIQLKSVTIKQYCDSQPDSVRSQLITLRDTTEIKNHDLKSSDNDT